MDWRNKRNKLEKNGWNHRYHKVLIPLEEALTSLYTTFTERSKDLFSTELVPIWETGNRILAENIEVKEAIPPFHRSPLDGYALRYEDTKNASPNNPIYLSIIDEVPAGHYCKKRLREKEGIKILTGAPLPQGANAVIRYEETEVLKDTIKICRPVNLNEGVAPSGEDLELGEIPLKKGDQITPAALSVLASLGISQVPVYRKPRIGIFCTGDELIPVEENLEPGKIHVSNLYTIGQLVKQAGGDVVYLGLAKDNIKDVSNVYHQAKAAGIQLLLSTGGVSAGDYDVVKDTMEAIKMKNLFWKIALRPGTPVAAAANEDMTWIALSGSPSGAIIMTMMLVFPLVKRIGGGHWSTIKIKAKIGESLSINKDMPGLWWAKKEIKDGETFVFPMMEQRCGMIKSYLKSDCLLEIPSGKIQWKKGSEVYIYPFEQYS